VTTSIYTKDLEVICDAIPAAVIAVDINFRVRIFNPLAEALFDLGRHNVLGRVVNEIAALEPLRELPIGETLEREISYLSQEKTLQINGQPLPVTFDIIPLSDPGNQLTKALVIIKNYNLGRPAENHLHHLEILANIGRMNASTIHEIRNPLTSISGFIQLLEVRASRQDDQTAVNYCTLITNEITHINNILSDFLALAKPQENKIDKIDIVQLVRDVLGFMYGEARLFQISLLRALPDKPIYILGNGEKIKEVLINICRNAFQSMSPGGILTIRISESSQNVHIAVTDTGHGMTDETIANIFKPFFTTKETGTGLGLAICQRIMLDHRGEIQVESELDKGSTFSLLFPSLLSQDSETAS